MSITTVTHLNFRGNADQALTFYASVFGGHKRTVTYQQAGAVQNPGEASQIMWGQVNSANGFAVMAYDVPSSMAWEAGETPFFISVRGDSEEELKGYWNQLVENGEIVRQIGPAAWTSLYGMVKDRFGITWVLDMPAASDDY